MKTILFFLLAFVVPCAAQTPAYTVTDIGTLDGLSSSAAAVNNKGEVVGTSDCEDGKSAHAFFFDGSHILDMGTLGGTASDALSVNDKGQVVGKADVAGDDLSHAFLWQNGVMTDLHILDTGNSEADGINNVGQIAGWAYTPFKFNKQGVETRNGSKPRRALLQTGNTITYLPDLYATGPNILGINDSGQTVGSLRGPGSEHLDPMPTTATQGRFSTSFFRTDYADYACIWQGKTVKQLKSLSGQGSEARAVNGGGQIVGKAALRHNKIIHACLWQNGTIEELGTVGGDNSQANAINNKSQIVGWSDASDKKSQHAFLYDNGHMTDLNTLIDHKYGWVLLEATGISDTGFICGTGVVEGTQHAFLLTPTPPVSVTH